MPARPNGIVCASPSRYTSDERATILSLIRLGGEVAATPERIGRAKLIATAWVGGRMVGVAALKRPLDSYRAKVAERAGVKLKPSEWPFELGYVFVLDDQRGRGLARSLTDALIREAGSANIFATCERITTVCRRCCGNSSSPSPDGTTFPTMEKEFSRYG